MHGQAGRSRLRERHRVTEVVAVAVGHEHHVADPDGVGRLRALRVAEPRIEQDRLAAGRLDLDAGMAVPGERRIATETHRGHLRGGCYNRRYTRAVPATQIGQNLAFVNWTVLTGLALGSFAAVVMLRRRTSATPGYLRLHDAVRDRLRGPRLDLRRGAAGVARLLAGRRRSELGRASTGGPGAVLHPHRRRPRRTARGTARLDGARDRGGGGRGGDAGLRGARLGRWFARRCRPAGPARGRQRRDRRRLRGDDPRPLVSRHAEAPRGAVDPARARVCCSSSPSRSSCSGHGSGRARVRPIRHRSRRWSDRGPSSSGCA